MSKSARFVFLLVFSMFTALVAQSTTIDFETVGSDWTWVVTENATNPPMTFPSNPDQSGINTSATVAEFIALDAGNPWALCFTDDIDNFTFDATNSTVTIMVHKPVVSNVAIKFEGTSPAYEIQVPNTVTDQWEQLTFDFSPVEGNSYNRLIIIPDFADRTQDNTIYFDNIVIPQGSGLNDDATLSDLQVDGETINGFSPTVYSYDYSLEAGTTDVPTVTATPSDPNASHVVNDATALPGTTEVVVTAENGTVTHTYSVNFTFEATSPQTAAPVPDELPGDVISIYSDSYANLPGTNYNPGWGQSTVVTFEDIEGNEAMKYANFNYQGTQLSGNQNMATMEYVHIDMWTQDATVVLFTPISATTGEHGVSLTPINPGSWNSFDIPVTDFVGVSMTDIHQLKFDGQAGVTPSTIYLDNIYFWKTHVEEGTDATLSDLQVNGSTVTGFSPSVYTYDVLLPWDTVDVPTVTATTSDPEAGYVVNDAASLPGTTDVVVTAENNINTLTYSINFTVDDPPAVVDTPAPDPTQPQTDVISIYSDSYNDVAGTNFNPYWGQSTVVTFEDIEGNNMMKYDNFNYQGTQLGSTQDLSLMDYVHIDLWSEDATVVLFSPISLTTGEFLVSLTPLANEQWNSFDIPLSDFTGINMADIHQLKFDGQQGVTPSTVYLDNIYFWKEPAGGADDATLSDLQVDGQTVDGFSPVVLTYEVELPSGTAVVPTVTASANDSNASVDITETTVLPGTTDVLVTAEDNVTTLTYHVNFTYAPATPTVAAPTPTEAETDVISLYSNAYNNVTVDTWSAGWDQADVADVQVVGNDTKLYTNLTFAGIEFISQTIDATQMTHFHMDVWTPDDTSAPSVFKVKLVDFGADGAWSGGDDVEHELVFGEDVMNTSTWVGLDIPLTDFTGLVTTGHLAQMIISGDPNTVYIDNVYFYSDVPLYIDAPENVEIAINGSDVTVTWDAVPGAGSYIVYSCDTPDGTYTPVAGGTYGDASWTGTHSDDMKFFYVTALSATRENNQ